MTGPHAHSALAAQWKYWGAGFNVPPWPGPVDLEQLLIDTAQGLADNPRLLVMAVTWLAQYQALVDVEHLARLATNLHGRDSARLGLLLEMAHQFIGTKRFAPAIGHCRPWNPPEPLFDEYRTSPGMVRLAKQGAGPISRRWGLWAQPIGRLKRGAMRPAAWIARHNPSFVYRTLLKGDVRSKVMITLAERGLADATETDLTRLAGCTRRAMHLALANLESAGLITRRRLGRRYAIRAVGAMPVD